MSLLLVDLISAFSERECGDVQALAGNGMAAATVWNGSEYRVNDASRHAAVTHIERDGTVDWLFERMDALFALAADKLGCTARPLEEPLQLLRYEEGCHFQQWHSDAGLDAIDRRLLSVSLELSEPTDYEGGDLQIAPARMSPVERPKGSACIFHSRLLHRVTPVTRGTRWALVGWTAGERE